MSPIGDGDRVTRILNEQFLDVTPGWRRDDEGGEDVAKAVLIDNVEGVCLLER